MSSHKSRQRFILYAKTFIVPAVIILAIVGIINSRYDRSVSRIHALLSQASQLESMVIRAETLRDVKHLQYAYGHYMAYGMRPDLTDLFTDNGPGYNKAELSGKKDTHKNSLKQSGRDKSGLPWGFLNSHIMLQPVVTLAPDGKSARGRWRLFSMLGSFKKSADWKGGIYENEYILEDGVWKIKNLNYYPQYSGPYEQDGWTIHTGNIPMHYTPDLAGNPTSMDKNKPPVSRMLTGGKTLDERLKDLQQRAQRLNDENDIKNLQNIYGYYVDRKMWDDAADLFANDGTMVISPGLEYVGRKSIRRAFEQYGPQGLAEGEINDHLQLQIIIHISPDGCSAKARGSKLIMSGKHGVSGEWGLGIFENEYVKQDGVWRIKWMRIYPGMRADYDKGWAKGAKPATKINKKFTPDRSFDRTWDLYPKLSIPRFHYNNPVSEASPRYPEGALLSDVIQNPKTSDFSKVSPGRKTAEKPEKVLKEIELLVRRAIAYDACENLTSAYGYYIDEFNWDGTADLFAEMGWRELPFVGVYEGRERIRESLKIRYPETNGGISGFFTCHQLVQPVIHVSEDGRSAYIRVRLFQLAGADKTGGLWMAGIYEKKAVIEDNTWKLTAMDLDYTWTADYKGGWPKGKMSFQLSEGDMLNIFPPDRPLRGPSEAPYPEIEEVPFHYVNPVSGRRPPLLISF